LVAFKLFVSFLPVTLVRGDDCLGAWLMIISVFKLIFDCEKKLARAKDIATTEINAIVSAMEVFLLSLAFMLIAMFI
jgi:hypothetical protein